MIPRTVVGNHRECKDYKNEISPTSPWLKYLYDKIVVITVNSLRADDNAPFFITPAASLALYASAYAGTVISNAPRMIIKMTGRRTPRNVRRKILAGGVFTGRRQLKSAALNTSISASSRSRHKWAEVGRNARGRPSRTHWEYDSSKAQDVCCAQMTGWVLQRHLQWDLITWRRDTIKHKITVSGWRKITLRKWKWRRYMNTLRVDSKQTKGV